MGNGPPDWSRANRVPAPPRGSADDDASLPSSRPEFDFRRGDDSVQGAPGTDAPSARMPRSWNRKTDRRQESATAWPLPVRLKVWVDRAGYPGADSNPAGRTSCPANSSWSKGHDAGLRSQRSRFESWRGDCCVALAWTPGRERKPERYYRRAEIRSDRSPSTGPNTKIIPGVPLSGPHVSSLRRVRRS